MHFQEAKMCLSVKMLLTFAVAIVTITLVTGCSEPEGGFVEPTPADKVYYAGHVVVGTVKKITRDPLYGDMYQNSTYGAEVFVRCSYKGGPIRGYIIIGGAGKN